MVVQNGPVWRRPNLLRHFMATRLEVAKMAPDASMQMP
jgi:hypothetical protein